MNDERELLRATVEDLLAEHCTTERVAAAPGDGWDAALWQALESTGLTLAGSPEEAGGSGGDLAAAADIAVAAGAAAAPVPLAETLAAGMVLARAGLDIPAGPLTLAVAAGRDVPLRRVPYGRLATTVAVGADQDGAIRNGATPDGGEWLAVVSQQARVQAGRNLAGEPRDEVVAGAEAETRSVPAGTADHARHLLRLFRSLLIAGAAQRALDLTVGYVNEREQFGRPLARFPAVQQEVARMAGEVALITAATQAAVAAGPAGGGPRGGGRWRAVRRPGREGPGQPRGGDGGRDRAPAARRDRHHPGAPAAADHHPAVVLAGRGRPGRRLLRRARPGRAGRGGPRRRPVAVLTAYRLTCRG